MHELKKPEDEREGQSLAAVHASLASAAAQPKARSMARRESRVGMESRKQRENESEGRTSWGPVCVCVRGGRKGGGEGGAA